MTLVPVTIDPYTAEWKKHVQLEPRFTAALGKVTDNGFTTDLRHQSEVLWEAARLFPHVDTGHQKAGLETFLPRVPRVHRSDNPSRTLKNLLHLPNQEDIYRCLTVGEVPPRPWVADDDEHQYMIGGWIGHYLEYAKHNECNLAFHFWSMMCIVGAICQRKLYYDMGQFQIYLNSYTILTGDSASGKSIARGNAMGLLKRFNRRMLEAEPSGPDNVIVLPNESTPEYMVKAMDNLPWGRYHPSGIEERGFRDATALLDLDELSTFLNRDTHSLGIKVPMLVRMQDADVYDKGTATEGEKKLKNCALSILGLAAPEWFKESITPAVRKGGLLDRIMFIHRKESSRRYTLPLDPVDPLIAESLVTDMLSWAKLGKMPMEATPSGLKYMQDYSRDFTSFYDNSPARSDYERSRKRQIVWVWRLAGLLAVTYGEAPFVSEDRFEQAMMLLLPETKSTEALMHTVEEGPDAEMYTKITQYIDRKGGCATHKQVMNNFYRRVQDGGKSVKQYLAQMKEAEVIVELRPKTTVYRLPSHEGCPKCLVQRRRV